MSFCLHTKPGQGYTAFPARCLLARGHEGNHRVVPPPYLYMGERTWDEWENDEQPNR